MKSYLIFWLVILIASNNYTQDKSKSTVPQASTSTNKYYRDKKLVPIVQTDWDEIKIKEKFETMGTTTMEGIYQVLRLPNENQGLPKIKIAVIKKDEVNYDIIFLGDDNAGDWKEGELKGKIIKTATPNFYIVEWYTVERILTEDVYCHIDDMNFLNFMFPQSQIIKFLKLYPAANGTGVGSSASSGTGTGFALTSNGYLVTAQHVVNGRSKILVTGIKGNNSIKYNAIVIIEDKINDLAILKVDDEKFDELGNIPYSIRNEIAEVGEKVFALGYPMTNTMGSEIKLTDGIINSKTGFGGDVTTYQFSAPVQPGNSGGPLYDNNGNLIGIISAKHRLADNAYYAVKVAYLKSLIENLQVKLKLQDKNLLKNKNLTEQLKILKDYVYFIEVK